MNWTEFLQHIRKEFICVSFATEHESILKQKLKLFNDH